MSPLDKILRKDRVRYLVLRLLYEVCDGAEGGGVNLSEFEVPDVTEDELEDALQFLAQEDMVELASDYAILKHRGIVEYEHSVRFPDQATEHFSVQVFNAPVGVVQNGAASTANVQQGVADADRATLDVIFCGKCGSDAVDVSGWTDPQTARFECHACGHAADVPGFTIGRAMAHGTHAALEEARADRASFQGAVRS